jgi:hypothetical protein
MNMERMLIGVMMDRAMMTTMKMFWNNKIKISSFIIFSWVNINIPSYIIAAVVKLPHSGFHRNKLGIKLKCLHVNIVVKIEFFSSN